MADNSRIEDLKRRVQSDPASIAFAALAEEYRRAGHYEEAIATCRAGLERHPAYLSAHVTLGRALIEVTQFDEARQELEYVLKLAPENLAAIRGLAEIHDRRGQLREVEHSNAALEAVRRDLAHDVAASPSEPAQAAHAAAAVPVTSSPVIPAAIETAGAAAAMGPAVSSSKGPAVSSSKGPGLSSSKGRAVVTTRVVASAAPVPEVAAPALASGADARTVARPVRVHQPAAAPDPALVHLEAFLGAIVRARQQFESAADGR